MLTSQSSDNTASCRVNSQTELVCTIGPACRTEGRLYEMILAGMNVARLHFAYADQDEHAENIVRIRRAAARAGRKVAILQDLPGSKVRIGKLKSEPVVLKRGDTFFLAKSGSAGDAQGAVVNFPEFVDLLEAGDLVLLADGALRLRALRTTRARIICRVEQGGKLKSHEAVHVPDRTWKQRIPTAQDLDHLQFGMEHGVDWVAQSFVSDLNMANKPERHGRSGTSPKADLAISIRHFSTMAHCSAALSASAVKSNSRNLDSSATV